MRSKDKNAHIVPSEKVIEDFEGGSATTEKLSRVNDGSAAKSVFGTPLDQKPYDANIPRLCVFTFVLGLGNI